MTSVIESALNKWLTDNYNIGITEYRAVLHLSRNAKHELRLTELAQKVGLNQSSVTRLVGRMEVKKLAYRDTCPDDGRGVYAVLTSEGQQLIEKIREPYEAKIAELLSNISSQYPQLGLVGLNHSLSTISKLIS